jgi:hypothetical protein
LWCFCGGLAVKSLAMLVSGQHFSDGKNFGTFEVYISEGCGYLGDWGL